MKTNKTENNGVVLLIRVSRINENGPLAAEQMFAALHGLLKKSSFFKQNHASQEQISFEILSANNAIKFLIWTPKHLQDFIEGQIYAQYPDIEIELH